MSYLYMLGRSRALDLLRKRKRTENTDAEAADGIAPSPEESVFESERKRVVREAVDTLPKDMREAVYLVYFDGLSYEETAKVMKKTKKQVDNLIYRAKEKLRSVIGKEGEIWL